MTSSNRTEPDRQGPADDRPALDRRTVLKIAGGTAVSVAAFSGTASAHNGKFFGCERVCSGTDGDYAVVAVGDGYECRTLRRDGPRDDVPWDWDAHCYTATEGESVVGYVAEDEYRKDEGCWLCVNPNDCAADHHDDAEAVRDAIDGSTCGSCEEEMNVSIGCEPAAEPADDDGNVAESERSAANRTTAPADEPAAAAGGYADVVRRLEALLRAIGPGFWR